MEGNPVTVTSPSGVVDQVVEQLASGDVGVARAERLIGSAELLRRYGRGIYGEDWRSARRLRDLRDAGVAVDDERDAPRERMTNLPPRPRTRCRQPTRDDRNVPRTAPLPGCTARQTTPVPPCDRA